MTSRDRSLQRQWPRLFTQFVCPRQGGETGPLPWERRSELGFFKGYWETTKNIMFNPNTAFDRVQSETGQWWDPLLYAIVSYVIGYFWIAIFYGISMGADSASRAISLELETVQKQVA